MLKKNALLVMALGLLVAFVLPTAALASWVDNGVALKVGENPRIALTGTAIKYNSVATGGVTCQMVSEFELTGGATTGAINILEPQVSATTSCTTHGVPAAEGCFPEKVTATELPWIIHNNTPATTISVTTKTIDIELRKTPGGVSSPCPKFAGSDLTAGTVTATPDNPATMSTLTLSGTLLAHPGGVPVSISGTLDILASSIKTYGL